MSAAETTRMAIAAAPLPIVLLAWKPIIKGALRGFADVQLGRSLRIRECPVLSSNGKIWANLPSKPLFADGRPLLDGRGKPRYAPIIEWADRQAADRFSQAVVAAVREAHGPEALEPQA